MNHLDHDFHAEHEPDDGLSLGELYGDLHDTVHALANSITDTEVEARLRQLLAPAVDEDVVRELADAAEPLLDDPASPSCPAEPSPGDPPDLLFRMDERWDVQLVMEVKSHRADVDRAAWEVTVSRMRLERERRELNELRQEVEAYREAAVERAGEIIADAWRERSEILEQADADAKATMDRAQQIATDAEELAKLIIADASSTARRSTAASGATDPRTCDATTPAQDIPSDTWFQRLAGGVVSLLVTPCEEITSWRAEVHSALKQWSSSREPSALLRVDHESSGKALLLYIACAEASSSRPPVITSGPHHVNLVLPEHSPDGHDYPIRDHEPLSDGERHIAYAPRRGITGYR